MHINFNQFVDMNMCNGFNNPMKEDKFKEILDAWIKPKPEIFAYDDFKTILFE